MKSQWDRGLKEFRINEKEADLAHPHTLFPLCPIPLSVFVFWLFVWTHALPDVRLVLQSMLSLMTTPYIQPAGQNVYLTVSPPGGTCTYFQ